MASDLKQWAEATHQGTEPLIVSLRETVMCMVLLTNAMLLVSTRKPLTRTLVEGAIGCARDLLAALEALHGRLSA